MKGLSPKQRLVLDILESAVRDGEHLTVREIGDRIGVSSTCTVHQHLKALERKGYLKPTNHRHRSIELTSPPRPFHAVPFHGVAHAGEPVGSPSPAAGESLLLPAELVGHGETALYQVRGNSMASAAIQDGDLVVIQPGEEVQEGDLVVALHDGQAVLTRVVREDGRYRAYVEKSDGKPGSEAASASVMGRVSLVIRRL